MFLVRWRSCRTTGTRHPAPGSFFNRGAITVTESNPTTGSVAVDRERNELVWRIGSKWKPLELTLPAGITFAKPPPAASSTVSSAAAVGRPSDDFCTGSNAYVFVQKRCT